MQPYADTRKPPNVEEADAFLSTTLYADTWAAQTPEKKQQAINSAEIILQAAYPAIVNNPRYNDFVYFQAAHMLSPYYNAARYNQSSRSVSTTTVSESFARSSKRDVSALFADEILGLLGDPYMTQKKIKVGRLL